ncbi:MAG: hypothetical protein QE278_14605 [Limnobacter sp.]|nr:hypothetical protein [Limnobacter sp.]
MINSNAGASHALSTIPAHADLEAAQESTSAANSSQSGPRQDANFKSSVSRCVRAVAIIALAISGGQTAHEIARREDPQLARGLETTPTCPKGQYYATRGHLQHVKNQMRAAVIGLSVGGTALFALSATAHLQGDLGIFISFFSGVASVCTFSVALPMTEVGRRYHGKLIKKLGDADGACVQSWTRYYKEKTRSG